VRGRREYDRLREMAMILEGKGGPTAKFSLVGKNFPIWSAFRGRNGATQLKQRNASSLIDSARRGTEEKTIGPLKKNTPRSDDGCKRSMSQAFSLFPSVQMLTGIKAHVCGDTSEKGKVLWGAIIS